MLRSDCGLHTSDQDRRCLLMTSLRVSKCNAIPNGILLKPILDCYRPDRTPIFYLNLYWALSARQKSSSLLKSILVRYQPDRNTAFYSNPHWAYIGHTGIQHSTEMIKYDNSQPTAKKLSNSALHCKIKSRRIYGKYTGCQCLYRKFYGGL